MPVDIGNSREHISRFLTKHHIGVLATADASGKPHAATVYLTFDQQFDIYFVTKQETQKSRNLKDNPRAAIAIYDQAAQTTVQVEGTVSEVTDPAKQEWVFNEIWDIAFKASRTGPPTTRIDAGRYVAYKLLAPSLRIARFVVSLPSKDESIFEVVRTQQ